MSQQQQQVHSGFPTAATAATTPTAGHPKPIRRRMRMITSCLECRRRKLKCNKSNPCINCLKFSRDCLYLGPKLDEASQLRLTEIKEKVGSLERQLERDVAKSGSRGFYQQRILADDVEGEFDEERDLEITPMVALDLTYEDDADGMDDVMDLGVQVGKMRLTEKIGGLNRPRISEEYATFWEEASDGYEPRASAQAVVFAAWFSAAVALDETAINREFGLTKANLVENMKIGTEVALSKANFLRTTRVETLQAFVMYMGPKPAIRREDYDTWLPHNCEEDQLTSSTRQPCVADSWTTTLFPLIRFEVNEMMRIVWADRRKLEARKITLTQVLTKIENFRKRMFENYNHLLDERAPIQRYAKLVMHLLMYRLHVMVLHPYYANTSSPMPQRLRSVLITSGITIIEIAIQLDTTPAFHLWRWYSGAYQQYQASLILATEMFYHPNHREASRIWACLDYVFSLDHDMTNEEKGKQVLSEIMTKMGVYTSREGRRCR
ncbi:putative fungal specific transcription factor domain-containing protein [Diaporthe ampelina]|uniref:Putative fungal specific transcription factor domain-containing protein n=1 Tax=Diaporthe ampelina TaxID=1214573 RepID=A0A0G2HHI2_9PEZI|nr:putative fungal specific transcription factor domain-containing protein [Diaporthe ampelina]